MIDVSASLLSLPFTRWAGFAQACDNLEVGLHLDVMDGHFVPNMAMGPDVAATLCRTHHAPTMVHLMCTPAEFFVELFLPTKPSALIFHLEATKNAPALIRKIQEHGIKAGVAINPETSPDLDVPLWDLVEVVLVMTVRPGHGGQTYMSDQEEKISQLAARNRKYCLWVDGGIDDTTIQRVRRLGVDGVAAGSYLAASGVSELPSRVHALRS